MYDIQTPIGKKKTHILGMTIPQIGLLGGMGVIQVIILVVALKYIVFAPAEKNPIPIPTAIVFTPPPPPTLAPTPIPDYSTAVLTIDDLPAGFITAMDDTYAFEFNEMFPNVDLHPVNRFTMYEPEKEQFVYGWTFMFTTTTDRENFDILITHPNDMFYTKDKPGEPVESLEGGQMEKSSPIGELSTGWSVGVDGSTVVDHSNIVLFSHKNFGAIVAVDYKKGQTPAVDIWEVARMLDNRILDVMVNGPIPTPVVVAYKDLANVKLTLGDLPGGFQAMPDSDIKFDPASSAEMEKAGMRVAGMFYFLNDKKDAEEIVLGYTFLFTSTYGKAVMDQLLAGDEMLDAMFERTPTQRRVPITLNQPIGDRALATAIMEVTGSGGVRCDVLVFRRGRVGAAIFHIYIPGRRVVNVENLGVILDKKFKELNKP